MSLEHLIEVHSIDVIRTNHDNVVRPLIAEGVHGLEDGIGAAGVPALTQSLLSGYGGYVATQQGRHAPSLRYVPIKRVRLVLSQHHDSSES